jgi:putative membrane protein
MTRGESVRVFLFGVFELIAWQKKMKLTPTKKK